jgi:hypothetical protein
MAAIHHGVFSRVALKNERSMAPAKGQGTVGKPSPKIDDAELAVADLPQSAGPSRSVQENEAQPSNPLCRRELHRNVAIRFAEGPMSNNDKNPSPEAEAAPSKLSRRLILVRAAGVVALPMPLIGCVVPPPPQQIYAPVGTGITDADPNDGPGNGRGGAYRGPVRGTGISDADPNDGAGNGRGGYRGPVRRGTGITDSDPNDGPGNGRGGYRRSGTGITDSDPNDGPGNGRGGYRGGGNRVRTGYSDADPNDGAGYGRGRRY